jgi:hypothetical protein
MDCSNRASRYATVQQSSVDRSATVMLAVMLKPIAVHLAASLLENADPSASRRCQNSYEYLIELTQFPKASLSLFFFNIAILLVFPHIVRLAAQLFVHTK